MSNINKTINFTVFHIHTVIVLKTRCLFANFIFIFKGRKHITILLSINRKHILRVKCWLNWYNKNIFKGKISVNLT